MEKETAKDFAPTTIDRFGLRCRYFSDSGIIGNKEYVRKCFAMVTKADHDKIPNSVSGLSGFFSLKRLSESL